MMCGFRASVAICRLWILLEMPFGLVYMRFMWWFLGFLVLRRNFFLVGEK